MFFLLYNCITEDRVHTFCLLFFESFTKFYPIDNFHPLQFLNVDSPVKRRLKRSKVRQTVTAKGIVPCGYV